MTFLKRFPNLFTRKPYLQNIPCVILCFKQCGPCVYVKVVSRCRKNRSYACEKGKRRARMFVKQKKPLEIPQKEEQKIVLYGRDNPDSDFISAQI